METIFSLSFLLTAPFWGMMIAAPRWRWTQRVIGSTSIVLPAALVYVALILPALGEALPLLATPSLDGIRELLGSEAGATIGWIHFLAFDLFVGRWAFLDAQKQDVSHWLLAPSLFFILMLGPFGFTLYLLVRALKGRENKKT